MVASPRRMTPMAQFGRLALHTWTVDTTPLPQAMAAAAAAGFDAVELRRIDFKRCLDGGMSDGKVLDLVRAVPRHGGDVAYVEGAQALDHPTENRCTADRQKRLMARIGQRPHPSAISGGEDDGLHAK